MGMTTMAPSERIATALAIWPGREADVAAEAGVSKSRLRGWAGLPGAKYATPTEADAERVERAVRVLLVGRLSQLSRQPRHDGQISV